MRARALLCVPAALLLHLAAPRAARGEAARAPRGTLPPLELPAPQARQTPEEKRKALVYRLLTEAYAALQRGEVAMARWMFESALQLDPRRPEVYKQLGYMSLAEGDLPGAAKSFEEVRSLDPKDYEVALQLGYIYNDLHNYVRAEKSFQEAETSPDPKVRNAAKAALAGVAAAPKRLYLDLNATPFYNTRYSNRIVLADAQLGWFFNRDWPVSAYAGGRYMEDSRSHGGTEPVIYSDNVGLLGGGLRFQPKGSNLSLSGEINRAFNLTRTAEHPKAAETDYRALLADYFYWRRLAGPVGLLTLGRLRPERAFTDLGASVAYYSRYRDNFIGLLQLREGLRLWENGTSLWTGYIPVNAYKDKEKDYYNNLVEVGAGTEFQPWIKHALKLRIEYLHGFYYGIERSAEPNPYGRGYNDARFMLIFSGRFWPAL